MAPGFYKCTSTIHSEGFSSLDLIGSGPHGRVYKAHDVKIDSTVAIKKLEVSSPIQEEKLKQEIIAIKKTSQHRNILPIIYALVRPRIAMLIMPVKQGNLHTLMPLTYNMQDKTSDFYGLVIQMLSALTYLQEEGISHRNVKPTNILVEPTRRGYCFYLTDFALTQPASQGQTTESHRRAHVYHAPELWIETYPITIRQDVWSLFVTLAVACRQVSELDLSRKTSGDALQVVMGAGIQMAELMSMAQLNPVHRAPASVMFQLLRPKETVNSYGQVEYPEVSPEYILYGSGRLETDTIAVGPLANLRSLDGPLGISPLKVIKELTVSVNLTLFAPLRFFDTYVYDQDASSVAGSRESSASPVSIYSQPPPGELLGDAPLQGEQLQHEQLQHEQLQHEQLQHEQRIGYEVQRQQEEQDSYRCTASCCTIPPISPYPPNSPNLLPPLRSIIPMPPSVDYSSPCPRYQQMPGMTPQPAIQRATGSDVWRNRSAYDFGLAPNANSILNGPGYGVGQQGGAYVRPYPLACDHPTESSVDYSRHVEDLGEFSS